MKRIMEGHYEYKGYTIYKHDHTRTKIAGAIIEWTVLKGELLTGKQVKTFPRKKDAKDWIDNLKEV